MKMEALTPMLRTRHLKESVEFYTTVLGFQCTAWSDTRRNRTAFDAISPRPASCAM
jgi:catechol 2,3-dioxygenase-like lactoylglutathione lyase family enzyme